jgi:cytochrome c peroxidase
MCRAFCPATGSTSSALVANDPDAARIRMEEAALFQEALTAANSGALDPFHQVETLGKLEIFDPNLSVNNNLACSYCHDPMGGFRKRLVDLEHLYRG